MPASVTLVPQTPSRGGGQATSGFEQVVRSPALRWMVRLTDVPVRTRQQILAWRTIESQLDGRAGTIRVPVYDWARGPTARRGRLLRDPGRFKLSTGGGIRARTLAITLAADAAVNATTLSVSWVEPPAPEAGQHFSLGSGLHRIVAVQTIAATGAGTNALVTIRPWTRAAFAAGTQLDFDEPACVCRLAKDDGMTLDLEAWRIGHPSVDFVEAT